MCIVCYTTLDGENKWRSCEDWEEISRVLYDEGVLCDRDNVAENVRIFDLESDRCIVDIEDFCDEIFQDEEDADGERD